MEVASINGCKLGRLSASTGVGTVTINIVASLIAIRELVKVKCFAFLISASVHSKVWSLPFCKSLILTSLISKPITVYCLAKASANGKPT